MSKPVNFCVNMNHSKMNVSIQFCPMCGEKFSVRIQRVMCLNDSHMSKVKNRDKFCCDCGLKLSR